MEKLLKTIKGFENIKINSIEEVQRLWKNQGKIVRLHIQSDSIRPIRRESNIPMDQSENESHIITIIVKYINPTDDGTVSSQRKIKKKYRMIHQY